jgi:hypothetical protein
LTTVAPVPLVRICRCSVVGAAVDGSVMVGLSPNEPLAVGICDGSTGLATAVSAGMGRSERHR